MRYLLDTHVFLWLLGDPDRLARAAVETLSDLSNELFVSAASVWELAIKQSLDKIELPGPIEDWLPEALDAAGAAALPVTPEDAARIRTLPWHHRDPFDRLLVVQANAGGLILVSADTKLAAYDVRLLAV